MSSRFTLTPSCTQGRQAQRDAALLSLLGLVEVRDGGAVLDASPARDRLGGGQQCLDQRGLSGLRYGRPARHCESQLGCWPSAPRRRHHPLRYLLLSAIAAPCCDGPCCDDPAVTVCWTVRCDPVSHCPHSARSGVRRQGAGVVTFVVATLALHGSLHRLRTGCGPPGPHASGSAVAAAEGEPRRRHRHRHAWHEHRSAGLLSAR